MTGRREWHTRQPAFNPYGSAAPSVNTPVVRAERRRAAKAASRPQKIPAELPENRAWGRRLRGTPAPSPSPVDYTGQRPVRAAFWMMATSPVAVQSGVQGVDGLLHRGGCGLRALERVEHHLSTAAWPYRTANVPGGICSRARRSTTPPAARSAPGWNTSSAA